MIPCTCTNMLYSAAETARVRTLPEIRLHQATCIGCGVGCESSVTRIPYVTHGFSVESGRTNKAMMQGRNQHWVKTPM